MIAIFIPVTVSKKNKQTKQKYVFYCILSKIHINPEKKRKNTKMTSSNMVYLSYAHYQSEIWA